MKSSQSNYLTWLNNEYSLWGQALSACLEDNVSFLNFKKNPQITRMIGLSNFEEIYFDLVKNLDVPWDELQRIDSIGSPHFTESVNGVKLSAVTLRYIFYASKVLENIKKVNLNKIVEIGGGYGGFASILDCIAKHQMFSIENYYIYDLPKVQLFQKKYLNQCLTDGTSGILNINFMDCYNLDKSNVDNFYCVSFYALGEFDRDTKNNYIDKIVSKAKNGLILWNPHDYRDIDGEKKIIEYHSNAKFFAEYPLTSNFNLEIIF